MNTPFIAQSRNFLAVPSNIFHLRNSLDFFGKLTKSVPFRLYIKIELNKIEFKNKNNIINKMPHAQSNSSRTAYPHVFSYSYWGAGQCDDDEIYANRNLFASHLNLKKCETRGRLGKNHHPAWHNGGSNTYMYDHSEFYCVGNTSIRAIIFSPYAGKGLTAQHQEILDAEWVEILPMYSSSARTFITFIAV